MNIKIIIRVTFILLWVVNTGCASGSMENADTQQKKQTTDPVDKVLEQLNKSTLELESYQGQIEYKFIQPSLFDSQDLRKGILYYVKEDNKSKLRVNFQRRKQDEDEEHKYIEQYIVLDGASLTYPGRQFKGTWLVCADYQIEEVKFVQLAEPNDPNKPVDVFDLASKNLPIDFKMPKGFSEPEIIPLKEKTEQ